MLIVSPMVHRLSALFARSRYCKCEQEFMYSDRAFSCHEMRGNILAHDEGRRAVGQKQAWSRTIQTSRHGPIKNKVQHNTKKGYGGNHEGYKHTHTHASTRRSTHKRINRFETTIPGRRITRMNQAYADANVVSTRSVGNE